MVPQAAETNRQQRTSPSSVGQNHSFAFYLQWITFALKKYKNQQASQLKLSSEQNIELNKPMKCAKCWAKCKSDLKDLLTLWDTNQRYKSKAERKWLVIPQNSSLSSKRRNPFCYLREKGEFRFEQRESFEKDIVVFDGSEDSRSSRSFKWLTVMKYFQYYFYFKFWNDLKCLETKKKNSAQKIYFNFFNSKSKNSIYYLIFSHSK